jgi:two-component system, OmpR family, sensor histidine kinase KdpD
VMVCMSSSADAPRVVRRGKLMAAGLGASLYAVYVETARERPDRIPPRDRDALARNVALAQSLGATVVRVKALRTVDGLIEFARREGITHVILGETQRSRWELLLRGSVLERFLREVPDASVQVLGEIQG